MTNEEIVMLIKQGINVADNMQLLYEQNKSFIHRIAKKLTMFSEIEDLMQESYFGLYEAVTRFDSSQEVKFLTYAAFWIKQVLRRYVDNNGRVVRIPVHELSRVSQYQKAVNECILEYGEAPSNEYLCYRLGVNYKGLENIKRIVHTYSNIQSLDEPCGEDESSSKYELIPGESNVEDEALENVMREQPDIWDIIEQFIPENEFEIVCMRYNGKMSLEAVAKDLGISRERVRQLETKGIRHLRYPRTIRAIEERYDSFQTNSRHTIRYDAAISQMGITRSENAEKRRRKLLESIPFTG